MRTFPEAHASHTPSALQRSQLAVVPLLGHAKHCDPAALGFWFWPHGLHSFASALELSV